MPILSAATHRMAAFCVVLLATLAPARAELATPAGEVILTVGGAISETNGDGTASFDMAMLQAMPSSEFSTSTTWTDGTKAFKGVPLKTLLDSLGAKGSKVIATALNNYSVEIPMEAIRDGVPIMAYTIDGAEFSRRDKGPLWIVFPYDSSAEYQTELVYGWSIWQLASLTVVE
ncbi:molybdopterin-dependent oxidoreductase [Rhodobacteraceae bacterium HSP-20]|uniref:Molybdopterin-dependent oxidoreductase n=1 Tax=Paragemmobacter amnigenus TaxID=2852097 RepID=A0ABS6J5Y7_9RHOB|nr:molybdopterin-dependent oxidoreductase [Rhodobacter amnigenus]MBU9699176.1 molybdopterin-dependent oxidoreductase [Rhodobacter amnigenus]MBV4390403.1 molybdopterin-dependent oxidoreductase [Rhodobacter amnigenus]